MDYDIVWEYDGFNVYLYVKDRVPIILGPFETERDASLALADRLADSTDYTP